MDVKRPVTFMGDVSVMQLTFLFIVLAVKNASAITMPGSAPDKWPYFYPDDPIQVDVDTFPVLKPREMELSQHHDFLENTFLNPGSSGNPKALNTNSLGEVH